MHTVTTIGLRRTTRRTVGLPLVGALASLALAVIVNPAVLAFAHGLAPVTHSAQTLAVRESLGTSSVEGRAGAEAAVSPVDAYGGRTLASGTSNTRTLTFTNTGTAPVTAITGTAASCSHSRTGRVAGTATDLCEKVSVLIATGGVTIFSGTAASLGRSGALDVLAASGARAVGPGESIQVSITISLARALDNSYQGLQINQPIQWQFGA